jgi:urease accessory protein
MEVRITEILGFASDPALAERLHELGHAGRVEHLMLAQEDVHRRRLRAQTDQGTDCLIALPREQALGDGAVLVLDEVLAVVVHLAEEHWLAFAPRDAAAALELGYFAGNLHWRVRFEGDRLLVALEGQEEDYLSRLKSFLDDGRARRADHD